MESNMVIELSEELLENWNVLLENVNAYVFGEEFDEVLFSEAMKGAFEVYDAFYFKRESWMSGPDAEGSMGKVLKLTWLMSEYMADRYTSDTDNERFRASQLAVRLMLGRITTNFQWHEDGLFPVYELEYYYGEDDKLVYDVKKGDLSDMVNALQYM